MMGFRKRKILGFTLFEMVIVMTVSAVIAAVVGTVLIVPFRIFATNRDQAGLIYRSNLIVQRMNLDLTNAVSASVRTTTSGSSTAIEYLHALDVRRYHSNAEDNGSTAISFGTQTTSSFNIWGAFATALTSGTNYTSNYQSLSFVIGNVLMSQIGGNTAFSVYTSGNQTTGTTPGRLESMSSSVITPKTTSTSAQVWTFGNDASGNFPNDAQLAFNFPADGGTNPNFPQGAPIYNQWVYVTDGPVSYVCDLSTTPGSLIRYSGYELLATQPILAADFPPVAMGRKWRSDAPIVSTVLSDAVTDCSLSYTNKVLTIDLTLTLNNSSLRVLDQIYAAQ